MGRADTRSQSKEVQSWHRIVKKTPEIRKVGPTNPVNSSVLNAEKLSLQKTSFANIPNPAHRRLGFPEQQRATLGQEIKKPAVSEPELIHVQKPSGE